MKRYLLLLLCSIPLCVGHAGVWAETLDKRSIASAEEGVVEFNLVIQDGQVVGGDKVIRVTVGDQVRLHWSSDAVITLHLHGYDIERHLDSSAPAVMGLKAYATGRFPVTVHVEGDRRRSHHGAALIYLEVMPK